MAKEDDDWKAFMDSIDEPDEEVETDDDSAEDENLDDDDDENHDDPKKSKEAAKGGKSTDDKDDPDEGDSEDEDDAGKGKPKSDDYKPRLKQFIKDDGSYNLAGIEKSYIENSKETVRINGVLEETNEKYNRLVEAIKSKPEAAKLLLGEEGAKNLAKGQKPGDQQPTDPLLIHVKAQMDNQSKKEYSDFVEAHPESVSDPEKARKIGRFLKIFGQEYREEHDGEFPSMKEGLEAAYRYYGWDLEIDKKEQVATAAKKTAATRSTANKKTPAPAKKKNELEGFFAQKLGVKLK